MIDDAGKTDMDAADKVAPFTLSRSAEAECPVIFASPHSGQYYPNPLLKKLRVPLLDLRQIEDAFVNDLFSGAPAAGATLIAATHARSFVDLNRDARELDPDMIDGAAPGPVAAPSARVQAGLGCFPRIGARGENIYSGKITADDARTRLEGVHAPYHTALADEIRRFREAFGCAILIDCHSMPSNQPGRRELPDIVLGDRFGSSCTSQLTNLVERAFRKAGYTVVRNAPYAGGYTTRRYGRPKRHVHALQIEINRQLYMDETLVEPKPSMQTVISAVQHVISEICRFSVRLSA
ncbi:N-formylglutamate amidohydrolase [Henriciella sp. AS95]|uniref:N-formylglutamate amidohydrolase n=1 Tax=Henriciella sp. AS95 TaxID=3135782 RepID=UPI00317AD9C6